MNKYEPELRFKGFIESWLNCKFNDILKTHNYKPFLAKIEEDGEYPIIQQGDKPIVGYSNNKPFQCYRDVTLFGDHTLSLYLPMSPFLIATDGVKILSVDGFEGRFLYTLLEKYLPKSEGYKRHFTILKNNNGYYPEVEERKLLGDFFSKLDNTINYHEQELETLKQTKQGFLQKMFPKEGETVPEVRFDGFDTEWVQYKFNDLIKLTGGATPFKDNKSYWNGDIVWLSSQEIKNKYVSEGTYKITKQAVKDNRTKIVPTGTPLIVTRSGILAKRFPLSISNNEVAINQDIKALIYDQKKIDTEFLVAEISSKESYILSNIVKAGTTVQSVNIPDLEKMNLSLPCFKEQIKIGQFFKKLDKTIELHEKEVEALKQTKKAFLQKMFV